MNLFSRLINTGLEIIPQVINPRSAAQTTADPTPGGTGAAERKPESFFQQNKTLILAGGGVVLAIVGFIAIRKLL